ncbi:LysE family translocator [Pelagicoccus sp. SDUM812002]|uniref:LysE family translocator n=1 Tax=Pelagicoccus sp. SDUM812002 TaxID=3041266 RepID=UPI00280EDB84|nr:LysE family translocator [Pelagicoccus sp. SDUM812002]MDQ8187935.1 LysE family translocator [Pelagicoccus sp. SDUM812002]
MPGPAVAFIVARSVADGRRAGCVTASGICLGNLIHAIAAAWGVSALIASSRWALDGVRYAGAAYLIYLGVLGLLGSRKNSQGLGVKQVRSGRSDFLRGILVALLNPKVILFLLAFLPQFVDPTRGEVSMQLLVLGMAFVGIGWLGDSAWALLSGSLAGAVSKAAPSRWLAVLSALFFIALGVLTVFSGLD